uniref:WxxW domain-containing protein n=1 Tax=Neogobius melanostomus TaxID=47308 RepID=A0A8C6SXP1_9GOBI
KNSDQRKGRCSDYKVRFLCPIDFCTPPPGCWTDWFDRDNPSGKGDFEILRKLHKENPGKICNNPLQIQVLTTGGQPVSSTGDIIDTSDTEIGFICKNSDQKKGRCSDYKVRFLCPTDFCAPPPAHNRPFQLNGKCFTFVEMKYLIELPCVRNAPSK